MRSSRAALLSSVGVDPGTVTTPWSSAELRQLRELALEGMAVKVIAVRLNRTESSIRNKAGMHGISLRRPVRSGDESDSDESTL